ncbi:amino acid permease [Methanocella sp. MCL-LM]|uniref:amino acid permease n=1 Tax=Methanocella sp. MCL-LM TaxID=3412035 RepID=UPI003C74C33F
MDIFRKKSIDSIHRGIESKNLKRTLGAVDLVLLGIGCVIGTGIFVLTGIAAARYAGPGITISFIIAGIACIFTALAYAELAAAVPASGTVYAYSYVSLGEIFAWLAGWSLILEYSVGASAVAAGWSGYLTELMRSAGLTLPEALSKIPADGGLINLPAALVVLLIMGLLVVGTKESATLNKILVFVKLAVIFLFIILAAPAVNTINWEPLLPFGLLGVAQGASIIFFAYTGFDVAATAAEECRNPNRDLPIGIIGSLVICTILYIVVAAIMTGVVSYTALDTPAPVTYALNAIGQGLGSAIVGVGAIAGITTVLLVLMFGQSRLLFSMSRDGLIPERICKVHHKFGTPHLITLIVGLSVALVAGFMPMGDMAELANVCILFVFILAAIGVLVLRIRSPDLKRPFRCPALPIISAAAIFSCSYLIFSLSSGTWYKFVIWCLAGLLIYFGYSCHKSHLNKKRAPIPP